MMRSVGMTTSSWKFPFETSAIYTMTISLDEHLMRINSRMGVRCMQSVRMPVQGRQARGGRGLPWYAAEQTKTWRTVHCWCKW
jgi:hypothetical protein